MARWFFRSKKRDGGAAKRDPKRVQHRSARPTPSRTSKASHRDQPAPLTWTTPDQDFITRYGDPFDG